MLSGLKACLEKILEPFHCARPLVHDNPVDSLALMPDVYLQLCVPAQEPPRSDLRPNLKFIGTFLGANDQRPPPDWFQQFVVDGNKDHPLIVVTQGTLEGTDPTELILPTVEVCRDLPVRLVVCAANAAETSIDFALPDNVRWAQWIPFELLFQHTSIVVSNGGYSGISQAFAAGIPMVLAGLTEDKSEATYRAALTGAAVNLASQNPSKEQIKDAIQAILNDKSYKEKALQLQKDYAAHDAVGSVVRAINEQVESFYGAGKSNRHANESA
jgi:UDP:flavonoid glycosyltransferase YjiC (YdhE family)